WDSDAKRLGGLEVDDQLDFHRLLDRQFGRLGTFENPPGVTTDEAISIGEARAVTPQAPGCGKLAPILNRPYRMTRHHGNQSTATAHEQRVGVDQERVDMLLREALENGIDLTFTAGVKSENLPPASARRCPDGRRFGDRALIVRVDEQADDGCSR